MCLGSASISPQNTFYKGVHRARILHQPHGDLNTQKIPQLTTAIRERGRVLAPGKCAHSPASANTSGLWDRLVLVMPVSINSVSESLRVQ